MLDRGLIAKRSLEILKIKRDVADSKSDLLESYKTILGDEDSIVDLCWRFSHLNINQIESFALRETLLSKHYYKSFCAKIHEILPNLRFNEAQIILSFISDFNLPVNVFINTTVCNIAEDLTNRILDDFQGSFARQEGKKASLIDLSLLFCSLGKLDMELDHINYHRAFTFLEHIGGSSMFGYISSLELLYAVPSKNRHDDWLELKCFALVGLNNTFELKKLGDGDGDSRYWTKKMRGIVKLVIAECGATAFNSTEINSFCNVSAAHSL